MAYKVLGQINPAATTVTALYTVPAAKAALVSSFAICNRAGTATTFRLSVAIAGAADAVGQYLFYDVPLPANETFVGTIGMTLAAGDVVRAYAGNASTNFTLFGDES